MKILFAYALMILIYSFFENSINYIFINYIYESDLKDLLFLLADQDFRQFQESRYKKSSRLLIMLLITPLLDFNLYLISIIIFLSIYEYMRPYLSLKNAYKQRIAELRFQFPIWLRQVQILLYNNNVLNAMDLSLVDAPKVMALDLVILLDSLKTNPNDIGAFSSFMSNYKIQEIERAMKLLYRSYVVDQKDANLQLERMIASTTKWMRDERLERNTNYLSKFEWVGIIPLFGVTIIFLVMMASLINSLFGKGVSL
ncbi:MAG: hypothetical protein GX074_05335 [Erysipelothrix sp.]|nr:hypothetical protein [Erysipelothrix sp.]